MASIDLDIHAPCKAEIARLTAVIEALSLRIGHLEERLALNSSNSGKPPSSDPPHTPPIPSLGSRQPSGRTRGAQPGHKGKKRNLLPPDQVNHFVPYLPESCGRCGSVLRKEASELDPDPVLHQVIELPPLVVEVTEHQLHARCCESCGETTRAQLPISVTRLCVGPRLQAFTSILASRFKGSKRSVEQFLPMVFGENARISLGTISNLEDHTSKALKPVYESARKRVALEALAFADETPWPEMDKQRYLWTVVAALIPVTVYNIARRTRQAFEDFLPDFKGTIHCDRYGAYEHLKERRCFCWEHLKRDFKRLILRGGASAELGEIGLSVHKDLFQLWRHFEAAEFDRPSLQRQIEPLKSRLKNALDRGTKCPHSETVGFCINLINAESCLWRFAEIEGAKLTNNYAEQAVRLAAILRKLSFGTDSDRGSRFMERMLTVIETCRRQGRNVLEFVQESIEAVLNKRAAPTLIGELTQTPARV